MRAETADDARRGLRNIAFMAKRLAPEYIGKMHLDHRQLGRPQRIQQSHRCVRVGAAINDDGSGALRRLLDPIDQFAFRVALPEIDAEAEAFGLSRTQSLDVGERLAAVDFRLAAAQHIQVGAVEYQDRVRHDRYKNLS